MTDDALDPDVARQYEAWVVEELHECLKPGSPVALEVHTGRHAGQVTRRGTFPHTEVIVEWSDDRGGRGTESFGIWEVARDPLDRRDALETAQLIADNAAGR